MATKWVFQNGMLVEKQEYDLHTGEPIRPKWAPRSLPCLYLGDETGQKIDCQTCGGGKQIPIYECSVHGYCSPGRRLIHGLSGPLYEVPWCLTCSDYKNGQETAVEIPAVVQDMVDLAFPNVSFQPHVSQQTFTNCSCCGGVVGISCPCSGKTPANTLTATLIGLSSGYSYGAGCDGTYTLTRGPLSGLPCAYGDPCNSPYTDGWSYTTYVNGAIYKIPDTSSGAASGNSILISILSGLTDGPIIISGVTYPNQDCNIFSGINVNCALTRGSGYTPSICYHICPGPDLSGFCMVTVACNGVAAPTFYNQVIPISCSGTFHMGWWFGGVTSGSVPCISGQFQPCQVTLDIQGGFLSG